MSFHAAQTFTFGEQPSASKWQFLWDNDYALADGSGISNNAIITRHLTDHTVLSAKLGLSNAYTGGVASQANAGTAGGTMKYINLGGMKVLWGRTAVMNGTGTFTVTFPTSFFTAVDALVQAKTALVGTGLQIDYQQSLVTASGASFVLVGTAGGAGNGQLDYVLFGN